jgi:hypothetical protein
MCVVSSVRIFHLGAVRILKHVDRDLPGGRGSPKWDCRNPQTEIIIKNGYCRYSVIEGFA